MSLQIQQRIASSMVLLMLAALMMLIMTIGLVFVTIGIYFLLVPAVGHGVAGLIVGGALLGLVVLVLMVVLLIMRIRQRRRQHRQQQQDAAERETAEQQLRTVLGNQTLDWARRHQKLATGAALAAGVALSINPRTRGLVTEAVAPLLSRRGMDILKTLDDTTPSRGQRKKR